MNYIVLDLEWNQCPDGKKKEVKALPFEIVEIGAVKLDELFQQKDTFHAFIYPVVYKNMNIHTQDIISLSMSELKDGKPFVEVIEEFLDWCGEKYWFCTWGPMDLTELQRNMKYFGVNRQLERPLFFYDIQKLFSLTLSDGKDRISLEHAVDQIHIEKNIPFHRAYSDAWYTAEIMRHIDIESVKKYTSIDYFYLPQNRKEEIRVTYDTYSKYVSMEFNSKEEAMADKEVIATRCYICHKNIKRKLKWFSYDSWIYYSLMYCDVHGWVKGKIRMKKSESGKVFAIKTIKITDQVGADGIQKKLYEVRERRKQRRG